MRERDKYHDATGRAANHGPDPDSDAASLRRARRLAAILGPVLAPSDTGALVGDEALGAGPRPTRE